MSVVLRAWADWLIHSMLSGCAGWLAYLWTWTILSTLSSYYWLGRYRPGVTSPDARSIRIVSWCAGLSAALLLHAAWDNLL